MQTQRRGAERGATILRPVGMVSGVVLATFFGMSLLVAVFLVALRTSVGFRERVRGFNKHTLNPVVLRTAGHRGSPYAVIHHVGRRSGRSYATPVRVRATPEGFILPLPYGRDVDWLQNVLAADGGTLTWHGQDNVVGEPLVTDMAAALARVPLPRWRAWLWRAVLARTGLGVFPCVWLKRLASAPAGAIGEKTTMPAVAQSPVRRWTPVRIAWDAWRAARRGPPAIAARQSARLAELVSFARAYSPYYRHLYQHLPSQITDIRQLPPVTKPELMAHFDEWVTDPALTRSGVEAFVADLSRVGQSYLGHYLVYTTSGTTGEPALLVQDDRAWAVYNSVRVARGAQAFLSPRVLWTLVRHRGRVAGLYVTGGHYGAAAMMERRRQSHLPTVHGFSVLTPLAQLVADLNAFQPVFLGGYATILVQVAQEQSAGRLRIHPVMVASTAETLTALGRQQIAAAFGCPVLEGYGASEAPVIALECQHGRLHVNSDWCILEPVDEAYQPTPAGEPSHTVLVTNLANYVQPIIRYDLGDSVTMVRGPCPCGSPLPAIHVEGRSGELLTFISQDGQAIQVLPLALVTVVEESPGIRRCQLIQTTPTTLSVRFETLASADVDQVWVLIRQRLGAFLAKQGLTNVAIARANELPGRDPRTGKFRHVWSEVVRASGTAATGRRLG